MHSKTRKTRACITACINASDTKTRLHDFNAAPVVARCWAKYYLTGRPKISPPSLPSPLFSTSPLRHAFANRSAGAEAQAWPMWAARSVQPGRPKTWLRKKWAAAWRWVKRGRGGRQGSIGWVEELRIHTRIYRSSSRETSMAVAKLYTYKLYKTCICADIYPITVGSLSVIRVRRIYIVA